MTDNPQLLTIFCEARERRSPEERAAYLDEACGSDAALRERVEELFRAERDVGNFLQGEGRQPKVAGTADEPQTERPGTRIGPYKLLQQIGEGGMGVVFMAEQERPVRRKVALKIIKPGMDSTQVIARFEAERQALALMDHQSIARVLDAGTAQSGRPYFVMELVRGVPITKFCDDNRLTPRERLELFVPVCQAIQHAHQKGIIHRDVKPSNILVALYDGKPVPKVIDFGVAKATEQRLTERTLFTQFGQVMGTVEYMSPEQAEHSALDIDTRSDIYSLGVLLYELLTGSTPLQKQKLRSVAFDEMLRMIREEEPPRPSTRLSASKDQLPAISAQRKMEPAKLTKLVRGELDWIVMKALEKDRGRRYETANGFARDIQRYLADEPVEACPPSTAYKLRKLARKNKGLLRTAAAFILLLAVGSVVSTWQAIRATRAETEALDAQAKEAERADAEREARLEEKAAKRHARLHQANALVGQAHGTRLSRRPGQRFEALDALARAAAIGRELDDQPPEWFARLRNEAIAALALPDIHITREFGSFPPGSRWVELNDDFTLYVLTTNKGGCTIRRVDDDTEIARLPELGEPAVAQFGSGRILAVHAIQSHGFQLWDLSGAEPVLRIQTLPIHWWSFRNDGQLLALANLGGSISVYETASGKRVNLLAPLQEGRSLDVLLHPTAPFVACSSYYVRSVTVRDVRNGAVVATAMPPWTTGSGVCWSPDGRTLLLGDSNGGLIHEYAFDAAEPAFKLVRPIQGPVMGGATFQYNPAGDRFVRRGWGNVVVLFDAISGQELFRTHSLPAASECYLLRFDRLGQRLAAARVGDRNARIGLWSVADAREYRALVYAADGDNETAGILYLPAIHPAGRLAAIGFKQDVALFDLETGRELARLPINKRATYVSFDGKGSLLTNGSEGFFRWPVKEDAANPGQLLIGPPERLPFHPGSSEIAASRDGHVIAQCMWHGFGMESFAGGWILHPNSPTPRRVDAGEGMGWCSVSPDGRWVAFGGPKLVAGRAAINVYETATAQRVWQSPVEGYHGLFSPDGRWLVTDADGGRAYTAGSWEPGPQLGPGRPWDVTSHLAVFGQTNGIYRLVELATGRELARLEDPELNTGGAAFTPDGTKLVVTAKNGLRVWDLRRIRAELTKLGLDWDAPPLSAASGPPAVPLSVHVELGDAHPEAQAKAKALATALAQARDYIRLSQWDKAAAEYAKADLLARPLSDDTFAYACLFLIRGDNEGFNRFCQRMIQRVAQAEAPSLYELYNLARSCALARKSPIDPARAVQWANQVVASDHHPWCIHVLGLARYRAGQFDQALKSFTEAKVKTWNQRDLNWFGLVLVHQRLGHPDEARRCLDKGIQWLDREGPPSPERPTKIHPMDWLEAQPLRREAEEMLNIKRIP